MPFGPEIAYPVDFISFMFTKCQNRKPFNYNKLSGFRESLDFKQFLLRRAEAYGPPHVGHQPLAVGAPEGIL